MPKSKNIAHDALWSQLKPNAEGLVPCISQDLESGTVLMLAWVNRDALIQTIETGWATFWPRSRAAIWVKGETSGNRQKVEQIRLDCDGDTLLYRVRAQGPACHLKTDTCFSHRLEEDEWKYAPENVNFFAPK